MREPWGSIRVSRWLARHRSFVAAASSVVLMAVFSLSTITVLQNQSNRRLSALNQQLESANRGADEARLTLRIDSAGVQPSRVYARPSPRTRKSSPGPI